MKHEYKNNACIQTAGCGQNRKDQRSGTVLMAASVASMIDQFNLPNIQLLQKMGYEVHVACNYKKGNTCDKRRIQKLRRILRDMHVVQHQWDCPRSIRQAGACYRAYRQMARLLHQHGFAWVHCHSPVGGALVRLAAHQAGVGVIYTAHGFHFYKGAPVFNWLFYYPAEKMLAHWTDVLVTVNREDCRLAERKFQAGRICMIPGVGIDTGRFQKPADSVRSKYADKECCKKNAAIDFRRKYAIPQEALLLLSVGELSRRKNHCIVLEAMAALSGYGIYYMICGQGILRAELEQQAKALGVSRFVRMPGFLEDVEEAYQGADIFVFPSLQEGMPAALMEAMAAGLPCVVSDIRGSRELVDEAKGGARFAADDAGGLCQALLFMMDSKRRKEYGEYNMKKIRDYDICAVLPKMAEIYEGMAGAAVCR